MALLKNVGFLFLITFHAMPLPIKKITIENIKINTNIGLFI